MNECILLSKPDEYISSGVWTLGWTVTKCNLSYLDNKSATHIVFEGVFRHNAVNLVNGVRRCIQAGRLTVIGHQQLVILLIGCIQN